MSNSDQMAPDPRLQAAIAAGLESRALERCPRHPDEIFATGLESSDPLVKEVVEAAPSRCPQCAEEDE